MLFIACNSFFFSAAKSSREFETARSFPDPKATASESSEQLLQSSEFYFRVQTSVYVPV